MTAEAGHTKCSAISSHMSDAGDSVGETIFPVLPKEEGPSAGVTSAWLPLASRISSCAFPYT